MANKSLRWKDCWSYKHWEYPSWQKEEPLLSTHQKLRRFTSPYVEPKASNSQCATSCNQGSFCHGRAILYPKDQGSITSIQWISSKTATTILAIQFLLEKQCPSPLTPPPCHHYVSSLLLKSSLENMEMSSEAWKERPNRPSICFNSTNIHFYSSLNQKQAAKYIFGGPLAPNMLPERHRWRFKNHPWGVPLGGPHLQHPFTTVNNICPGLKANKNLTNAHVL